LVLTTLSLAVLLLNMPSASTLAGLARTPDDGAASQLGGDVLHHALGLRVLKRFRRSFGAIIARGLDYSETFQGFRPWFDLDEERRLRAAACGNGVDPWRVVDCMIRMVRHDGGLRRSHVMAVVPLCCAARLKAMRPPTRPVRVREGPASLPIMSRCDCQIGQHRPDRACVDAGARGKTGTF
jgi:hypothetical protein